MSSNIRVTRICQHCGREFEARTTVTRYCGDPCAKLAYKARKKAEKIKESNQETLEAIERPIAELQSKEFLTVKETCELLGISRTTLWRSIKRGRLKVGRMGTRIIIKKQELQNLFN